MSTLLLTCLKWSSRPADCIPEHITLMGGVASLLCYETLLDVSLKHITPGSWVKLSSVYLARDADDTLVGGKDTSVAVLLPKYK
jgi:hypothetical protein